MEEKIWNFVHEIQVRVAAPYTVRSRGSGTRLPRFKYSFCLCVCPAYFVCPGQLTDKFSLLLTEGTKRVYLMRLMRVFYVKCLK